MPYKLGMIRIQKKKMNLDYLNKRLNLKVDFGYWNGYIGHKDRRDLHDYIDFGRGPRVWLSSMGIPDVPWGIPMTGFSGCNFDNCNIRPDKTRGYYCKIDQREVTILTMQSTIDILKKAVDSFLDNPVLLPIIEPVGPKILERLPDEDLVEPVRSWHRTY